MTSSAREDILARIRRAHNAAEPVAIRTRPIPARAKGTPAELRERFIAMAGEASATVDEIQSMDSLPDAIRTFLDAEGIERPVTLAPDPRLRALGWAPEIDISEDPIETNGVVGVGAAFAGIAETGTLMVHSGPRNPNQLHFLPETHIAVLPADAIVGGYEDAWARLNRQMTALPRSVTLITGPSRSSDIERQLQIGVHGPRRLHIVLCDGEKTDKAKPRRAVKDDEARLFEAAMRDVVPLAGQDRGPPAKSDAKVPSETSREVRSTPAPPAPPAPPIRSAMPELRRGVAADLDARTMERLRRGQLRPEARLDMHGMTQDEAHRALVAFIAASRNAGRRCVILITGRGRAKLGGGILREQAPRWMNQQPTRGHILGFAEAQPKDGGAGALYVLLRKRKP